MSKISNQYSLTNILTADLANSRLGINNVSPTVALDVTGAGKFSGASLIVGSAVAATNVKLFLNGVASKAASIEFQQSGVTQWYLGNGAASEDNNFELYNSNGTMAMKIIKSTNAIAFTGAATFSSSVTVSTGVRFGSGSTNLNYYEEGTWTPTFTASTSGTITVDSANTTARYTRIGRQVTVNGTFTVSSVSSPVGEWRIQGLPFTSAGGAGARTAVSVLADSLQVTATTSIVGYVDVSVTFITLYKYTAGSVATLAADVKAGSYVFVTATYFV